MKDTEKIARDIEATRQRIADKSDELICRIGEKRHAFPTDMLRDTGQRMLRSIQDNPVPLVVTSVGLGWLILRDATGARRASTDVSLKPSFSDRAKSAAHKVAEKASRVKGAAARGANQVSHWFETTLADNPTLLAIASLGAGLVAGLAMPPSQAEVRTAGKVGEKIAEAALDKSMSAIDRNVPEEMDPGPDYMSGS